MLRISARPLKHQTVRQAAMKAAALCAVLLAARAAATPGSPVRPDYRWANASAVEKWCGMAPHPS